MALWKRSKARAQRIHAKRRAYQRYGLVLNKWDLRELVTAIQSNKATHVEKRSNRVSEWDVQFHGETVRVVYDNMRKTIVTFLEMPIRRADEVKGCFGSISMLEGVHPGREGSDQGADGRCGGYGGIGGSGVSA